MVLIIRNLRGRWVTKQMEKVREAARGVRRHLMSICGVQRYPLACPGLPCPALLSWKHSSCVGVVVRGAGDVVAESMNAHIPL